MTEYELHQMIYAARWEFDVANIVLVLVSLCFFLAVQLRRSDWEPRTVRLVQWSYSLTAALIVLRGAASMVRFGKLNLLLEANDPSFVVTFAPLQVPTLLIRLASIALIASATMHFIAKAKAAPE